MTIHEIRKIVSKWKRRLNLEDWTITARIAELPNSWAEITPLADHGHASLVVSENVKCCHEYWILHELGHIVLAELTDSRYGAISWPEERAINRYTRALCRAYGVKIPKKLRENA